jgi:hypothetical protein
MNPAAPRPARPLLALIPLLLAGCATLPDTPPAGPSAEDLVAEATLAHNQLGALIHQDLLLKLQRGELREVQQDLCRWLADDTQALLAAVEQLPYSYHARTGRVLEMLRDEPVACEELEALAGDIERALEMLGRMQPL